MILKYENIIVILALFKMSNNDVNVSDKNIIEVALPYMTPLDVFAEKFQKILAITENFRYKDKPVLILIDYTGNKEPQEVNVKLAEKGIRDLDFDKMATFGANEVLRKVTTDVLSTVYKEKSVAHFDSKEEAEAWLLGNK
jgi:hypothetical protein